MDRRRDGRMETIAQAAENTGVDESFRFVVPDRPVRQRATIRQVRVGEVMQQHQADVLQEMMPTTLYGKVTLTGSSHELALSKAMVLLQLSCQYAAHCRETLEEHSSNIEERCAVLTQRIHRRRRNHRSLQEKKQNIARELTVLNCSLDAMKMMLQELNPDVYAKLTDETQAS